MHRYFRLTTLALVSAAAMAMPAASAQTIKPGLWESTSKTTSSDPVTAKAMADSQKQMAAMPAAQRKEMEKAMNKPGAPQMTMNADGGFTVKSCISQKMIDEGSTMGLDDANCKYKKSPLVAGTQSYSYTCANPPSSGEGKTVYQGVNFVSTSALTMTGPGGKKDVMNIETRGKWLGADCGAIKPVEIKPAAAKK